MAGKPKPKSPAAPPRKREVVIVADYQDPWGNDVAAEVKAMSTSTAKNPTWLPSGKEFKAVVKADLKTAPFRTCRNFDEFRKIIQSFPKGSLTRVSLITHSDPGRIGVGGNVNKQGKASLDGMNTFTRSEMLASETIDSDLLDKLNQHLDTNVAQPDPEQVGTDIRDDLRSRFDPQKGEIIIYGCHSGGGGLSLNLQILLSRTLGVSVKGFTGFIEYVDFNADVTLKPPAIKHRDKTRYESGVEPDSRTGPFQPGFLHLVPDDPGPGRPSSLVP